MSDESAFNPYKPPPPARIETLRAATEHLIHPDPKHLTAAIPPLKAGWLLDTLWLLDDCSWGRWRYWRELMETQRLPEAPLPRVEFLSAPDPRVRKMMERTLDAIPNRGSGSWQSMGAWEYFRYFLAWFLWGVGHCGQPERPVEPPGCEGAFDRLVRAFNVGALALWPYDYLGDLLAENAYGKRQGFFPTPMNITDMMVGMLCGFAPEGEDARAKTVMDPCVGTGRFLLSASNHSLRLYGMDIDGMMCQATLVNGYLYAPWLVLPLPFLDAHNCDPRASAYVSDSLAAQTPPHVAEAQGETEHDAEDGWRFEPIKKRRRKGAAESDLERQGVLF